MSKIHIGRGSIVVEDPEDIILDELRWFRRDENGVGQYENIYTISENNGHKTLVTMPGFADRLVKISNGEGVCDERMPMPKPDLVAAARGLHECWFDVVGKAVKNCGGIVAIPEILGCVNMAAAILRAFPMERLLERGTATSLVVAKNREEARAIAFALRKVMPERDVGLLTPGTHTDSDDIIVTSYGAMKDMSCWAVGVLIACNLEDCEIMPWVEELSAVRNAARWGIYTSASGGGFVSDVAIEGIFGNAIAQATYADATKSGCAEPIMVCWLPAPPPINGVGYGNFRLVEAQAIQNNPVFCQMVAEIMERTPSSMGCVCCTELKAVTAKIAAAIRNGVSFEVLRKRIDPKLRRIARDNITSGNACRAIISYDAPLNMTPQSVMIVATCKGGDLVMKRLPWKVSSDDNGRAYIVDFKHQWDFHNGRPGFVAINDESRRNMYKEFGFRQMYLNNIDQLPFLNG